MIRNVIVEASQLRCNRFIVLMNKLLRHRHSSTTKQNTAIHNLYIGNMQGRKSRGDGVGDISPPCFDIGSYKMSFVPTCFDPQICCFSYIWKIYNVLECMLLSDAIAYIFRSFQSY